MASVTFTTQSGTEISGKGFKSNSSFEILKAVIGLIERVELAEEAGTAAELLNSGILMQVGYGAGILLINDPDSIRIAPKCECGEFHDLESGDDEQTEQTDEAAEEAGDEILDNVIDILTNAGILEDPNLEADVQTVTQTFDYIEVVLNKFIEALPYIPKEQVMDEIEGFAIELRDFADQMGDTLPGASAYSLGAGITIGAGLMLFSNKVQKALGAAA